MEDEVLRMADGDLYVSEELTIPEGEIRFRASRSGGPGGQHVNTSATRIELIWSVRDSAALNEAQRARLLDKLSSRITGSGELLLAESGSRSQLQNRKVAIERLRDLLVEALATPKPRRRTRPPRAAAEKRLRAKKRRSELKKLRGTPDGDG